MNRVLGIDYGSVRTGLALSDPLGMIAQPLEVMERLSVEMQCKRIAELVAENEVTEVVLGNPLTLKGEVGFSAQTVASFAETLRKHVNIEVILWDERLTTAEAQKLMTHANVRRAKRKTRVDKIAATLILQSYLDQRGGASPALSAEDLGYS